MLILIDWHFKSKNLALLKFNTKISFIFICVRNCVSNYTSIFAWAITFPFQFSPPAWKFLINGCFSIHSLNCFNDCSLRLAVSVMWIFALSVIPDDMLLIWQQKWWWRCNCQDIYCSVVNEDLKLIIWFNEIWFLIDLTFKVYAVYDPIKFLPI